MELRNWLLRFGCESEEFRVVVASQADWMANSHRGIEDGAAWQHHWHRLAPQSESWHATSSGAVGRRFTAILAAEWREVI